MSTPETPDAGAALPVDATDPQDTDRPAPAPTTAPDDLVPPTPEDSAATAVLPPAFTANRPPAWEPPAPAPAQPVAAASVPLTRPRVRWAGIVWGLVLATIATAALWLLLDPARQAALTSWVVGLSPATAIAVGVLIIGLFALITGVVGIARRTQRGIERRRAASAR